MLPFAYRVNVSAAFPTQVVGTEGIEVSRKNGIYTIGEAFETLAPLGALPVPAQKLVKVWDSVTGLYNTVQLSVLPAGSGSGFSSNIVSVTSGAGYSAASTDDIIVVEKTIGSATTITLVASATRTRGTVRIKDGKGDASTNNITILFNGSEKADGLSSIVINTTFGVVELAPNPAGGWIILTQSTTGSGTSTFQQAGTGAVVKSMQDKAREIFSVADFGVTGNGTTDDTVNFRKAVAALSANGGTLFIPDKMVIRLSGTIDLGVRGRTTIRGTGPGSVIWMLPGSNCNMFTSGDGGVTYVEGPTYENLTLLGQASDTSGSAIFSNGCSLTWVSNCTIESWPDSFAVFVGNTPGGSFPFGINGFPKVQNCYCGTAGKYGFRMDGNCYGARFIGNTIRSSGVGFSGAAIYGNGNGECTITGNDFDENEMCLQLTNCARYVFSGNFALGQQIHGVWIQNCTNVSVTGNTLIDCSTKISGTYSGVQIENSTNVAVSGNTISKTTVNMAHGIAEIGTSNNNILNGNVINGVVSSPILRAGANTILASVPVSFLADIPTVSNATGDGTVVNVGGSGGVFDRGNNVSGGVFTAPVAGEYSFAASISLSGVTISHNRGVCFFSINGGAIFYSAFDQNVGAVQNSGNVVISGNLVISLNAGDTVAGAVAVYGSSKVVNIQVRSWISGRLVS